MSNRNLDKLNTTVAELNLKYCDMMAFKAIFIGALSRDIPISIWDYALDETAKLFKEDKCQPIPKTGKSSQVSQQS